MRDANQSLEDAHSKFGSGEKLANQADFNQTDNDVSGKIVVSNDNSEAREDEIK